MTGGGKNKNKRKISHFYFYFIFLKVRVGSPVKHFIKNKRPYEKELYQNICGIYLKYIAHICQLYVFTMLVYVSYMYMLHICRIRSNIYVTYM